MPTLPPAVNSPNQCLPQTLRIPYIGVRLKSKGPLSAPCIFIATKSAEFLKVFFPSLANIADFRQSAMIPR